MDISVSGLKDSQKIQDLKDAAEFYATILFDPRMARNITLDIDIDKSLEVQGECINEEDRKNPRYFTINLRNKRGDEPIIKTLAHEMVHVKQYAKNELGNALTLTTRGGIKISTKWQGEIWKPKKRECSYWDSPWEAQAYGLEVGLYHRWLDYKSTTIKNLLTS